MSAAVVVVDVVVTSIAKSGEGSVLVFGFAHREGSAAAAAAIDRCIASKANTIMMYCIFNMYCTYDLRRVTYCL